MTSWPSAVAGGLLGTLILTTVLSAASQLRLTRMDLPFLLGTIVTDDRRRAKIGGYLLHALFGVLFAAGYALVFRAIGRSGWGPGAFIGALHAVFVSTVLVNVVLPVVHPRMGTPDTAANEIALIEPPGFLMLNYGRNTFLVTFIAHIAYGALVGWAMTGGSV
jgi:hypothetical protein